MKRCTVFIGLLLVFVFSAFPACTSRISDQQLARIESQLQALTATLASTQQELVSTKNSLIEAENKTKALQQQLQAAQEAQQTQANTYSAPAIQAVAVIPDPYYDQYTPYNNYPYPGGYYYPHHPSPPAPSYPPFPLPPPPPPSTPSAPFYSQGSIVWPNGWGNGMNRVEVYDPTNPAHRNLFH